MERAVLNFSFKDKCSDRSDLAKLQRRKVVKQARSTENYAVR